MLFPAEMMMFGLRLWQLPPILFSSWWSSLATAALTDVLPRSHARPCKHDEHEQLIVPEPIEEQGEHALFA